MRNLCGVETAAISLVVALSLAGQARAQFVEAELEASGLFSPDNLGLSVAASDEWAVQGAPVLVSSLDASEAVVHVRSSDGKWKVHQSLLPWPTPTTYSSFGQSVALADDWLFVGAPIDGDDLGGAVYVYRLQGSDWVQVERLTVSDVPGTAYGTGLGIGLDFAHGRLAATSIDHSAAYVFDLIAGSWTQTGKIEPAGPPSGHDVAWLDPTSLLVGAAEENRVLVFEEAGAGWTLSSTIHGADDQRWAGFGARIAACGGRVLVGAPYYDDAAALEAVGMASIHERAASGAWIEVARFHVEDVFGGGDPSFHYFGEAVAIDDERALVGAPTWSSAVVQPAVYEYRRRTPYGWVATGKIEGEAGYYFGASIDLDGDRALVGDPGENVGRMVRYPLHGPSSAILGRGGSMQFEVVTNPQFAGDLFAVALSLRGLWPGIEVDGVDLHLNPDRLTRLTLSGGFAYLQGNLGVLDRSGASRPIRLTLPPSVDLASMAGVTVYAAGATMSSSDGRVELALNAVPIRLDEDCDGNGLLDSVEIGAIPALDCNLNGRLDSCDLLSGAATDLDGDGTPDECQLGG